MKGIYFTRNIRSKIKSIEHRNAVTACLLFRYLGEPRDDYRALRLLFHVELKFNVKNKLKWSLRVVLDFLYLSCWHLLLWKADTQSVNPTHTSGNNLMWNEPLHLCRLMYMYELLLNLFKPFSIVQFMNCLRRRLLYMLIIHLIYMLISHWNHTVTGLIWIWIRSICKDKTPRMQWVSTRPLQHARRRVLRKCQTKKQEN